jgi:hypothetical protein
LEQWQSWILIQFDGFVAAKWLVAIPDQGLYGRGVLRLARYIEFVLPSLDDPPSANHYVADRRSRMVTEDEAVQYLVIPPAAQIGMRFVQNKQISTLTDRQAGNEPAGRCRAAGQSLGIQVLAYRAFTAPRQDVTLTH